MLPALPQPTFERVVSAALRAMLVGVTKLTAKLASSTESWVRVSEETAPLVAAAGEYAQSVVVAPFSFKQPVHEHAALVTLLTPTQRTSK